MTAAIILASVLVAAFVALVIGATFVDRRFFKNGGNKQ